MPKSGKKGSSPQENINMRKLRNTIRDVTQAANTATKVSRAIMGNNPALAKATKRTLLSAGSNLGRLGGGLISPAAASMGARLGSGVAERISRLIGSGDYAVTETPVVNSLFKGARGYGTNMQSTFGDASIRMRHREYIQDIIAPSTATNFSVAKFSLNPGLAGFAPLISQIAANYEEYIVHGMVYEFKSGTSPYLSTSAMGTCVMAVEFNPDAADYQSKLQIENSECAISFRPDQSAMYGVECARNRTANFLVRSENRTTNLPSYDFGKMYFATALGSSSYNSAVLGELWVSYDIELIKPRLSKFMTGNLKIGSTTGVAAATPFGTSRSITFANGKLWNASCTSTVLTLPINAGDYFDVTLVYYGTTAAAVAYTATLANATAYVNLGGGGASDIIAPVSGTSTTTSTRFISAYASTSANPTVPVTLTLSGATLPTGTVSVDVFVTLYSSGVGNWRVEDVPPVVPLASNVYSAVYFGADGLSETYLSSLEIQDNLDTTHVEFIPATKTFMFYGLSATSYVYYVVGSSMTFSQSWGTSNWPQFTAYGCTEQTLGNVSPSSTSSMFTRSGRLGTIGVNPRLTCTRSPTITSPINTFISIVVYLWVRVALFFLLITLSYREM